LIPSAIADDETIALGCRARLYYTAAVGRFHELLNGYLQRSLTRPSSQRNEPVANALCTTSQVFSHDIAMEYIMLKKLAIAVAFAAIATGAAVSQQATTGAGTPVTTQVPATTQVLTALPQDVTTVTNYHKQNVYDPSDAKIGEISDVLLNKEGKVDAFMISVGGFLGLSEKDVAVPFDAIHTTQKDGKWYLTITTTKDALKSARGYKFDRAKSTWEPA
jgi:sporulation protein YlmC with PRC-barrel domain